MDETWMKTCNQGILKLCFVKWIKNDQSIFGRSFGRSLKHEATFASHNWHWPQFVGDCATKLGRPDLSKHGDA